MKDIKMPEKMYISNLNVHDVVHALKNDSVAASISLEYLMDEDDNLYTESELERLRYWEISIKEIFPNKVPQ